MQPVAVVVVVVAVVGKSRTHAENAMFDSTLAHCDSSRHGSRRRGIALLMVLAAVLVVIAALVIREGREAWNGKACC